MPEKAEKLMSVDELADYTGVPVSTIYRWNYAGTGPTPLKVGKYTRYRRVDVERWLADRQAQKAS